MAEHHDTQDLSSDIRERENVPSRPRQRSDIQPFESIDTVLTSTMGTMEWDLTLPIDVPVQSIIAKFLRMPELGFRERDDAGNAISYRLMWREGERYLADSETLRMAGLEGGHRLILTYAARAGSENISSSYNFLKLNIQWYPNIKAGTRPLPAAEEVGLLLLNLQTLYSEILNSMDISNRYLQISQFYVPNVSLEIKGISKAIKIFEKFLRNIPDIIVSICTIPAKIKQEKMEIQINEKYLSIIRDGLDSSMQNHPGMETELLRDYLRYRVSKEKFDSSLPVSIEVAESLVNLPASQTGDSS